ncbi:hypothetical protein [Streptomyces sp. SID3343]|uniref:hypothetical protein n=1 Tax=Streptomyces sp. SID3343 TaxID=2690260 RepID=UPI00136D7811|nr:hypothetical protein [Streptomyces sp. SID3343]MYW02950.1 hypothetical protein [Streptomyces sp. SID3343]
MSYTDEPTTGYAYDTGELHGLVRRLYNIRADYLAPGCFAEPSRVAADTALGTDAFGVLPGAAELTDRHRRAAARMVTLLAQVRAELETTRADLTHAVDRFTGTEADVSTLMRTAAAR